MAAAMLGFTLSIVIAVITVLHSSNTPTGWYLIIPLLLAVILYQLEQFSTDQLRDAPTQCSVLFLYAMLWNYSFSKTISASVFIDGNSSTFNIYPFLKARL